MPCMEVTPTMVNAMRDVLADKSLSQEDRNLLEQYGPTAKSLPMEVIELLKRRKKVYLHELLAGSSVTPPEPLPEKKKNPEVEGRLFKIRAELEDREYEMMTRDVRRAEIEQQDSGEIRTLSQSLGEGINILVAKGTAFAIGWFASRASWGYDPLWNMISASIGIAYAMSGLVGLILGFMIESLLFVIRSSAYITEKDKRSRRDKELQDISRQAQAGLSVKDIQGAAAEEVAPMLATPLSPGGGV